jgi:quercetin dioxygenase-like cupin family protein
MISEIPEGCHTGRHTHGEEGIFILEGNGFSLVKLADEDRASRYEWNKGSTLCIPFGAEHQHFNTGKGSVRYFSLMATHLEHWLGFAKIEQLEPCGETRALPEATIAESGLDAKGRRIVLPAEHVPWREGRGGSNLHARTASLMRREQGFQNVEVQIWGILSKGAESGIGGKHAHMEALLYVLDGAGYTIMDGERIDWRKGSCLHVQGPQTVHEHFCTSSEPYSLLRSNPGVRVNFVQHFALERFPYITFGKDGAPRVRDQNDVRNATTTI